VTTRLHRFTAIRRGRAHAGQSSVRAAQLLFDADDPYIEASTEHVRRLPVDDADRATILGTNAAKMFGLE
jgi:predicted TIM-barrel fold metal-dependent hydrolase